MSRLDVKPSPNLEEDGFKMAIESSGSEENDLAVTGLTVGNLKSSSLPESAKSQPVLSSVSIKF